MPELQIIGAPQSNYVWVTRIACTERTCRYTLVPVLPHSPEVDAIHPFGKIPAMRHGDTTLCESRAICFYIDHAFAGPPLAPRDPVAGAQTEQWISLVNTHIDPLLVASISAPISSPARPTAAQPRYHRRGAAKDGSRILPCSTAPSPRPATSSATRFTLADINLLPILFYLDKSAGKPGDAATRDESRRLLPAPFERESLRKPRRRPFPAGLRGK